MRFEGFTPRGGAAGSPRTCDAMVRPSALLFVLVSVGVRFGERLCLVWFGVVGVGLLLGDEGIWVRVQGFGFRGWGLGLR